MKENEKKAASHAAGLVAVTGKLPALSSKNLKRLSVFLTQGRTILGESALNASGAFQIHVAPQLASDPTVFVVLGPKGLDSQSLADHADLPRVALSASRKLESGGVQADFSGLNISDKLIDPWWIWCREYTVSGTLQTGAGCPIGAEVTVYNVTSSVSGLVESSIVTVPTDPNGNFTATFNWCSDRFCWWPCWPVWWYCWPWWWELDILAVIENLERTLPAQTGGTANLALVLAAPLRQPHTADLMTGVGFAASRVGAELKPDSARTALIASKFANPALREIFPWWWWCCENPNIVFSASQGATVILNEDPNTSTRWCFASGQTVSLTGNNQSVGACQVQTGGPCGFAWSSVGDEPGGVLVDNISMGYADGTASGACSNIAFNGSLNLNGVFGGDCIAFYQVLAGQWQGGSGTLATAGNPARGGTAPTIAQPLSVQLVDTITIWNGLTSTQATVVLGPCSFNGIDNLYMTRSQRQNPPAGVTGLPPFPTIPPGALWGWNAPDLALTVPAADLVSPATTGGVNLCFVPYDITGTQLPTTTEPCTIGPHLTLVIDTTPLTTATIDWSRSGVYNADNTPATPTMTGACPAYQMKAGGGYVLIHTTVTDDAAHLCQYQIVVQYGDGTLPPAVPVPVDRDYSQPVSSFSAASTPPPYGVDAGYGTPNNQPLPPPAPQVPAPLPGQQFLAAAPGNWTYVGGGDTFYIPITTSCCYDLQLLVGKRTTDGQTFSCFPLGLAAFQTVNIVVGS
jgi:hypothetical protein